ncbi:MAG: transporter [Gammaproteobacteria bacterium]|nr:MAG: transporter [Gammaproteobacteria bacterium]
MTFFSKNLTGAILAFSLSAAALAAPKENASDSWLVQQINKHPDIVAAKETMKAVFSQAQGSKKALYNPELVTGYEREGNTNNFEIGFSQKIDWWDKREAREQQANFSLTQVSKYFSSLQQVKISQALQALISYKASKEQATIANEQEQQLTTLLEIVEQRQQTGDLGQVDAELTYLSLSRILNNTALAQVTLKQAVVRVKELLPDWTADRKVLPAQGMVINTDNVSQLMQQEWLNTHPAVLTAKAQWQVSKAQAQVVLLNTKTEPTFGVRAGKVGQDTLIGLDFSMPLNIRNDFSEQARAANQFANAAESTYRSVFRQQKFAIQASQETLLSYQKNYLRWVKLMQGRGKRSEDLLAKQWQSGDMSTTQYLLALQQRAAGLSAGIELKSQYRLSQIDWLLQVGQLGQTSQAIKQLSH